MRTLLASVALIAATVTATPTQDRESAVVFEAASIKRHAGPGDGSFVGRQPGGRLVATAATVRELIEFAYLIQPFQLLDTPKWVDEERWDINAKLAAPPSAVAANAPDDTLLALRSMLAERFRLIVRRDVRPMPAYALVHARSDRRLGSQLTRSTIDCAALRAARLKGDTTPLPPAAKGCGTQGRVGSIQMTGSPLTEFTERLSARVQRTVLDRTGLDGTWDLSLTYAADSAAITGGALPPGTASAADVNAPSLFTALQEQLGLKLEAVTGPVDALVIERVERAQAD